MLTDRLVPAAVAASIALSIVMAGSWLIWRRSRNSGWVDVTWTFGLGVIGVVGALAPMWWFGPASARQILVATLIACWSLRLGFHIAQRTVRVTDDPRYAKLLLGWGNDAPRQMFWLLQKQALVTIPLALSMIIAAWNPAPGLGVTDLLGTLVLGVGILGEHIADKQLRRFRADPANSKQTCDAGLWRWSRHPNYFFEWIGWLAYPLLAFNPGGSYVWGWLALAGPACMYWLLVHVSGIPPLEAHMLEQRGDEFRAYQASTSAFFPAPPRRI